MRWPLSCDGKRIAVTLGTAALIAAGGVSPAAAQSMYIVGGGGFARLSGSADVADSRTSGWAFEGGIRREVRENILVGIAGGFYRTAIDADEFFASRDVFLANPDNALNGGDSSIFSVGLEGIYEYPVDRSTIAYGKLGAAMYSLSTSNIFTDAEQFESVPSFIEFPDERTVGGYAGLGVRFPLGESGGLWVEFDVHFLGADGGSARIVPLTMGISLP